MSQVNPISLALESGRNASGQHCCIPFRLDQRADVQAHVGHALGRLDNLRSARIRVSLAAGGRRRTTRARNCRDRRHDADTECRESALHAMDLPGARLLHRPALRLLAGDPDASGCRRRRRLHLRYVARPRGALLRLCPRRQPDHQCRPARARRCAVRAGFAIAGCRRIHSELRRRPVDSGDDHRGRALDGLSAGKIEGLAARRRRNRPEVRRSGRSQGPAIASAKVGAAETVRGPRGKLPHQGTQRACKGRKPQ